jgi:hypothetical protein
MRSNVTSSGVLGLFAAAVTVSCGGNGGAPAVNPDGGGTAGQGRIWIEELQYVTALDLATGKTVGDDAMVDQGNDDIYTMLAGGGQIWVGRADGVVAVVDMQTMKVTPLTIDAVETWGIQSIVIGDRAVYVGSGAKPSASGMPEPPPLVRIDPATLAETGRSNVFGDDFNGTFKSMVGDGGTLWVLSEPDFKVIEVDAQNMAPRRSAPLGESPDDPTGARGEFNGGGYMVQVGGSLWVVDETSTRMPLLRVDKSSLQATYVRSLTDEFGPAALDCLRLFANADSVFVLFCDDTLHTVARLDGATGATAKKYTGVSDIAVTKDKFYTVSPTKIHDLLEVDIATGTQRVVYTSGSYLGWIAVE